jgi:hypothetical protein
MKNNVEISIIKIKTIMQREVIYLGLSEEARKLRSEENRKSQIPYWLKKAKQYGIDSSGLTEEEVIRLARSKYLEEYWEARAKREEGE